MSAPAPPTPRPPRPPRPLTLRSVRNHALAYLRRYAATRAHLRLIMVRRARRRVEQVGGDLEEITRWIDETLDDLERRLYLDDGAFATSRAEKLREKGGSERMIRQRLAGKGASAETITQALAESRPEGDVDLAAARIYVAKKRLGHLRPAAERREMWQKDLARLGRAGFGYRVAKLALEGDGSGEG